MWILIFPSFVCCCMNYVNPSPFGLYPCIAGKALGRYRCLEAKYEFKEAVVQALEPKDCYIH